MPAARTRSSKSARSEGQTSAGTRFTAEDNEEDGISAELAEALAAANLDDSPPKARSRRSSGSGAGAVAKANVTQSALQSKGGGVVALEGNKAYKFAVKGNVEAVDEVWHAISEMMEDGDDDDEFPVWQQRRRQQRR